MKLRVLKTWSDIHGKLFESRCAPIVAVLHLPTPTVTLQTSYRTVLVGL